MIQLQHLVVRWRKEHRGPAGGAARKALPAAMPFQPPDAQATGWLQRVVFDAADDYRPQISWQPFPLLRERDGIGCRLLDDVLELSLWPIGALLLQKPARPQLGGLVARIPTGKRIECRVNTVLDYQAQRAYADHVLHAGAGDRPLFDLALHRTIDERAILY